jgi:putative FmdB family regulatory protein
MKGVGMPIFEFKCPKCGKVTELLHLHTKEPYNVKCIVCDVDCEKIISKTSFVIHGYNASNNYSTTERK